MCQELHNYVVTNKRRYMQNNDMGLRLYEGDELQVAIEELFSYESFLEGMQNFLPESLNNWILQVKNNIETIFDFQKNIIHPFLKLIERQTINQLTVEGIENLSKQERYLFISNHRDIGLDSAYLNMLLFDHGMPTSQIAIGDNLMKHRISELIFRINKSFVVKRTGTPKELYQHALKLSNYIKDLIVEKKDSVWIAQREGRAKDGNDRTQVSLLKMLGLTEENNLRLHFQQLKIVPVAISYEYDPCGILKTQEYLKKQANSNYQKTFQDDMESIMYGINGQKGRVNLFFGKVLDKELLVLDQLSNRKEQLELLAQLIDKEIHLNYRLFPINYVAHDLLMHSNKFASKYSVEEYVAGRQFFEQQTKSFADQQKHLGREYLLSMYANPVINQYSY